MGPEWSVTAQPVQPVEFDRLYVTNVEGLTVKVTQRPGGRAHWTVDGYLADVVITGADYLPRPDIDAVKAAALRAANLMRAAGITGSPTYAVTCCDRVFATRDAADQHEGEHSEEQAAEQQRIDQNLAAAREAGVTDQKTLDAIAAGVDPRTLAVDAMVVALSEAVHYDEMSGPVCGSPIGPKLTSDPADVTCSACRGWIERNAVSAEPLGTEDAEAHRVAVEERRRVDAASEGAGDGEEA